MKTFRLFFLGLIVLWLIPGFAFAVTGADWLPGNLHAGFPARSDHTSVVFNDRLWIIGGTNGVTIRNDTWSSADGVTWTQVNNSAEFPARLDAASVVFNNRMWIIGGSNAGGSLNDTWSSLDGNVWALANASAEFPARSLHTAALYNNKMWVIGGWTSTYTNDTWSSPDGNIWTLANASAEFPARSRHATVVFDNRLWTIGGFDATYLNDTWNTPDGTIWARINASPEFPARSDHAVTVFDGNLWVTGGQDSVDKRNDTWRSANGNIWTLVNATPAFTARNAHTSAVLGNRMWILGGTDSSGYLNDTWFTDGPPAPVPVPQPAPDSGSDGDSGRIAVQSSVKGVAHAGDPVTFTFGKALSPVNPVRIESVTVIPAPSVSGDILCLVKDASRNNPPVPAGLDVAGFAEIDLVWVREETLSSGTVVFSLDRNWLEGQKVPTANIVLLRFADGTWQELPTAFTREEAGREYFTAGLTGFSVFAVAAKYPDRISSSGNISLAVSPTVLPVTSGGHAPVLTTTVTPAPALSAAAVTTRAVPVPENVVLPGVFSRETVLILIAVVMLGSAVYLVRRWWIHRQNPALFRK